MARRCLVFRHVAFEDLGVFEPVLRQAGYDIHYREMGIDPVDRSEAAGADLLVVLGGPIGVYDTVSYPFLSDEIAAVAGRVADDRPTLGICLGLQLIATAAGAAVGPCLAAEIGWSPVALTEEGEASPLARLASQPVLHWHGDIASLPSGARRLAETESCRNQAFALGDNVLALQFHVEVDAAKIEQWLIGHAVELAKSGVDPNDLRADTRRYGATTAAAGAALLADWLASIAAHAGAEAARA
jgi:GMP synthase (glutamine-hydrolysing)